MCCPGCIPNTHQLLLLLPPLPASLPGATQSSQALQPHPNTVLRAHRGREPRAGPGQARKSPGGQGTEAQHSRMEGACGQGMLCLQPPHRAWPPPYIPVPQEQLPDLNTHFRSQSFHTSMYASSWFLTLFLTTFPLPVATRVFDIFMYEVRTPNNPSSPRYTIREINPSQAQAKEGPGVGEGGPNADRQRPPPPPAPGEQDQRLTAITFTGSGDCVPGGPRPAAGEPDRADAAGHGGDVSGGPGGPGWMGFPEASG